MFVSLCPSRSPLRDPEAHGRPLQHLLCIRSHQTQPEDPPSGHQPGHGGSHPLHVLAALLLRAQIRCSTAGISILLKFLYLLALLVVIPVFLLTHAGSLHPITLFTLASLISCIACYLFRLCLRKQADKSTSYQVSAAKSSLRSSSAEAALSPFIHRFLCFRCLISQQRGRSLRRTGAPWHPPPPPVYSILSVSH